jgi:3'-phosphoadenosine 5'-phosphosulfate sulfotransferase (PAPS reductase)/FAD synthetase/predicted RNA-binding protein with PUA domain
LKRSNGRTSKLVLEVSPDEQVSLRSWVFKGGLSWCSKCNVPVVRHNRCAACGSDTQPIDTRLRGETRPIFPGERVVQGIEETIPDDSWLIVTDNTDLSYNVIVNGKIIGDLVFDKKWKIKPSRTTVHAALYFPPKLEIDPLVLGHVLNFRQIRDTWITAYSKIDKNECVVFRCENYCGLAQALVSIDPSSYPKAEYALQVLNVETRLRKTISTKLSFHKHSRDIINSNWRFSDLPTSFRSRMQKAIEANLPTIEMMEEKALDRIDEAIKLNPNKHLAVSFSGGKDSALLTEILRQYHDKRSSSVKVHALFADTSIEFPETYDYVRAFFNEERYRGIFELHWKDPKHEFFELWKEYGVPSRYARWCCGTQKLGSMNAIMQEFGDQVIVCNGVRAGESVSRSRRTIVDTNPYVNDQITVQPILDWSLLDVWLYIFYRDVLMSPLYLMGYNRTGCYACPYSSNSIFATLEKTHPYLWDHLQGKLREFKVEGDFRFRVPQNLDQALEALEQPNQSQTEGIFVQNLCGGEYYVRQRAPMVIDMSKAAKALESDFKLTTASSAIIESDLGSGKSFRLLASGKMTVVGAKNQDDAVSVYANVMRYLTGSNGKVNCVGCEMGLIQLQSSTSGDKVAAK